MHIHSLFTFWGLVALVFIVAVVARFALHTSCFGTTPVFSPPAHPRVHPRTPIADVGYAYPDLQLSPPLQRFSYLSTRFALLWTVR